MNLSLFEKVKKHIVETNDGNPLQIHAMDIATRIWITAIIEVFEEELEKIKEENKNK